MDVQLPGGKVHYAEAGQGDPVVMIHGYAPISTWHVWDANIAAIAGVRRVLALDLPGYGGSHSPEGGRPQDFGEWFRIYTETVEAFIDALDLQNVALCGLSAGGGVALHVTADRAGDIQRLVLVDSAGAELSDRWKSISVSTLIFWQREDRVVPVEQGERLHSAIAGSRLEIFEGNVAGIEPYEWHWAHALNPERFNELASAFLT
jgi:pimeloyl-ACP methyl ester carboxylesterase